MIGGLTNYIQGINALIPADYNLLCYEIPNLEIFKYQKMAKVERKVKKFRWVESSTIFRTIILVHRLLFFFYYMTRVILTKKILKLPAKKV